MKNLLQLIIFYICAFCIFNCEGPSPTSGDSDTSQHNQAPVSDFSFLSDIAIVNEKFFFLNKCSGTISSYNWNFGEDEGAISVPTAQFDSSHIFKKIGTRIITLTVTGPKGSSSCSKSLTVYGIPQDGIITQFKLYDSNGVEKNVFKRGDDFEMRFVLLNRSGSDLFYHYTGTPIRFEIHRNNSIIATSVDGIYFTQVISSGKIKNCDTFKQNWIAPNSPARNPKLVLTAGNYRAFVKHTGFFNNIKLKETSPIDFVITN